MTSTLLIVQIVLTVFLVIAVLLQKSSSIGLGAYSGSNESMFGAKGPNSFLSKITFGIGFLFVVNTITLGYFYNQAKNKSIVDSFSSVPASPTTQTGTTPNAPDAPRTQSNSIPSMPDNVPSAPTLPETQDAKQ